MGKRTTTLVAVVAAMAMSWLPQTAAAVDEIDTPATYNGRTIDLSVSWEGANFCAVHGTDDVRCYDTEAEMIEDEGGSAGDLRAAALSDCPSGVFTNEWYCLYDGTNHTGRMLKFKDPGCQSLANFGFSNAASSWANTLGDYVPTYDSTNCGTRLCRGSTVEVVG
jgi:hypothetical protein